MLAAASQDKSIELSVIRDDNVVLPLKLDDTTLDFRGERAGGLLRSNCRLTLPVRAGRCPPIP